MKTIRDNYKIILSGLVTGIIIQLNWANVELKNKGLLNFFSMYWVRIIVSSLFVASVFYAIAIIFHNFSKKRKAQIKAPGIENFFHSFVILLGYLFFQPTDNSLIIAMLFIPFVYYVLSHEASSVSIFKNNYIKNLFLFYLFILIFQFSKDIVQLKFSPPENYLFYTKQCLAPLIYLIIPAVFPRVIKVYSFIILFVFFLAALITNMHVLTYGTDIPPSAYYAIWETNFAEALDYSKQYLNFGIVALTLFLATIMFLPFFLFKKHNNLISINVRLLIISLFFGLSYLSDSFTLNLPNKFFESYKKFNIELKTVQQQIEFRKNNPLCDQPSINCDGKDGASTIVMVIGESASKYHQGIYGYQRDTNPLLSKIRQELFIFDSVIAPHSQTNPVLSKVLTFANNENMAPLYSKRNIIEYMKAAGYKTFWLSNQPFAENNSTVATSIAVCANQYLFTNSNLDDYQSNNLFYDELLFKPFKIALINKASKKFIVLHLMGSHSDKTKRYTKNFEKFTDWQGIPDKPYNRTWVKDNINAHDNSVLYNDWILYNFIMELKRTKANAVFLYFSDHGEEIFDYRDFMGHAEANASIYMLDIPFILWVSDEYKNSYPERIQKLPKYLHRKYQTGDVIHSIIDLSGCRSADYDSTRSIFSPYFKFKRRLIGEKDYDEMIRQHKKSISE